jgi:RND family efflux transporter MFP subunit
LVKADETILTTIVSMEPIYAYFDIDERTVLRLRRLVREGRIKSTRESQVTVQVALADEDAFNLSGVVDFVDNQIDPTTGTLRIRAVIPNPQRLLSPGLFVRIRFPVGDPHSALLIPEESLATDQGQRFVYVIDEKNRVSYRRVKVGMLLAGRRVISEGLGLTDRVAVSGLQRLRKDLEVDPRPMSSGDKLAGGPAEKPVAQETPAPTASPPVPPPQSPPASTAGGLTAAPRTGSPTAR